MEWWKRPRYVASVLKSATVDLVKNALKALLSFTPLRRRM